VFVSSREVRLCSVLLNSSTHPFLQCALGSETFCALQKQDANYTKTCGRRTSPVAPTTHPETTDHDAGPGFPLIQLSLIPIWIPRSQALPAEAASENTGNSLNYLLPRVVSGAVVATR